MKWSQERVDALHAQILEGKTTRECTVVMATSKTKIWKIIKEHGLPSCRVPKFWVADRDKILIDGWNAGDAVADIADKCECRPTSVYARASELGLRRKPPQAVRTVPVAQRPKPDQSAVWAVTINARPWMEREASGQCAWPLGERGNIHSCCAPTSETYCKEHRFIAGGEKRPYLPRGRTVNRGPASVFDRGLAA